MSLPLPSTREWHSYMVYSDNDGKVKAKNGFTGMVDFVGSSVEDVINQILEKNPSFTGTILYRDGHYWIAYKDGKELGKSPLLVSTGRVQLTGDGSTKEFTADVEHGLPSDKLVCSVSSTKPTTAPPSYIYAYLVDKDNDGFRETIRLTVRFDTAPADGETFELYWRAEMVQLD